MKSLTRSLNASNYAKQMHSRYYVCSLFFLLVSLLSVRGAVGAAGGIADDASAVEGSLMDVVAHHSELETFNRLVHAAGFGNFLEGKGPYTLFAPSDAAFRQVSPEVLDAWLHANKKSELRDILKAHIVTGSIQSHEVIRSKQLLALAGGDLNFKVNDRGDRFVNAQQVLQADLLAGNGTIHIIDDLLVDYPRIDPGSALGRGNVSEIIRTAIRYGAPIYNEGNHDACAAIYEVALLGASNSTDPLLSDAMRASLLETLAEINEGEKSGKDKSWILRRSMDATLKQIKVEAEIAAK